MNDGIKTFLRYQKEEETGAVIYERMAKKEKNPGNRKIFESMAKDEKDHADFWQRYTHQAVRPDMAKVRLWSILWVIFGFTFVLKLIQRGESLSQSEYSRFENDMPEVAEMKRDENEHELALINMTDEERLNYVGSIVLGLNDALVELTGTIAGLTFAMANTRLIALSGIITGVSATLSMAASNYLAERSDGNPHALKSSAYTGVAYLITVAILVLPYLILPNSAYVTALIIMLCAAILVIVVFNYYISVAKSLPFFKRFAEMAGISLSVAAVSFVIGLLVKQFLGIDV